MDAETLAARFVSDLHYRRWFRRWWQQDFSTDGRLRLGIGRPASFPRGEIEFAGRVWFRFCAPPHDLEGRPNPNFSLISTYQLEELYNQYRTSVIDLSGCFVGDVSLAVPRGVTIIANFASFFGALRLDRVAGYDSRIGGVHVFVAGSMTVSGGNRADFGLPYSSIFGPITVSGANSTNVVIPGSIVGALVASGGPLGRLDLSSCLVLEAFDVSAHSFELFQANSAHFRQDLTISRAVHARGEVVLRDARFARNLNIVPGVLRGLDISGALVRGKLLVSPGTFTNDLSLGATFVSVVKIELSDPLRSVDFDGARLSGLLNIDNCNLRRLSIARAEVLGGMSCDKSIVEDLAIGSLEVKGKISGHSGIFTSIDGTDTHFSDPVDFGGSAVDRLYFANAQFDQGVDFQSVTPDGYGQIEIPQIKAAIFEGAKFLLHPDQEEDFKRSADFSGRKFAGRADFQSTTFWGIIRFDRDAFGEDVTFRGAAFKYALQPPSVVDRIIALWDSNRRAICISAIHTSDRMAHEIERGYSDLKDAARTAGNLTSSRKFHINEMRVRRRRRDREVGVGEQVASYIYDVMSDFGDSISKPLLLLFAVLGFFCVFFWVASGDYTVDSFFSASQFSLSQIVRPFGVWSPDFNPKGANAPLWISHLFIAPAPVSSSVWSLWIRGLALVQSASGLVLSFLLALSIRRRFQLG